MIIYTLTADNLRRVGLRPERDDNFNGHFEINLKDPYNLPADTFSISKYLVDIITSKHNQDVSIMVNGDKGSGKSNLSLSLGHQCAVLLAKKLGGHWSDYFSIDNMAVMDTDKLIDLFDSPKTHQIIISDDGGINNDSHKFMSNKSIDIAHMIITTRPKHNIYIITAPDQHDVNKTERNTADFIIQMVDNPRAMNMGFTIFKFKKRVRDTTSGKKIYKYLFYNNAKVLRCICPRAPPCLEMQYDKLRTEQMNKLTAGVKARKDKRVAEAAGKLAPAEPKKYKNTQRCEEQAAAVNKRIAELKAEGNYSNTEIRDKVCNELNFKVTTWYNYKSRHLLNLD